MIISQPIFKTKRSPESCNWFQNGGSCSISVFVHQRICVFDKELGSIYFPQIFKGYRWTLWMKWWKNLGYLLDWFSTNTISVRQNGSTYLAVKPTWFNAALVGWQCEINVMKRWLTYFEFSRQIIKYIFLTGFKNLEFHSEVGPWFIITDYSHVKCTRKHGSIEDDKPWYQILGN